MDSVQHRKKNQPQEGNQLSQNMNRTVHEAKRYKTMFLPGHSEKRTPFVSF